MAASNKDTALQVLVDAAGDLLVGVDGDATTVVGGASYDSRRVTDGDLFFCIPGTVTDGHLFASTAIEAGAVALCVERRLGLGVPEIVVSDVRRAMPQMSAALLGYPADDLLLIGVTGTNGKTTTVYLLESILRADGHKTGLIGTIETRVAEEVRPGVRTTPESLDLQELFEDMRESGVDAAAMEVTSHALVLGRVEGVRFSVGVFTNLTQDHLDFHGDMDAYLAAKSSLFAPERCERAAINLDDPSGLEIAASGAVPVLGFGSSNDAEVRAEEIELNSDGSTFRVRTPKGDTRIRTQLIGPFNVSNCLAAVAAALQAGIDLDAIEAGIGSLAAVPGRFESVAVGQPFTVVVDYAHTTEALDNVLDAARRVSTAQGGRVVCVFGCGGDRDRGKRPLMGIVASKEADVVIVTSDNPRSEDPEAIIGAILEGIVTERPEGPDAALPDRHEAISYALRAARPNDVVVIAGKGHETGQEFSDRTIPFDDREVVRAELARSGWTGGGGHE